MDHATAAAWHPFHRTANREYTLAHRFLEMAAVAAFFVGEAVLFAWVAAAFDAPGAGWLVPLAALAGYLAADFVSGMVHWAGDTLGDEDFPLLGKGFIRPFREHHVDEKDITRHDFLETNGNNCLVTVPVLAGAWAAVPVGPATPGWLFGVTALAVMALAVFGTNQFHKWAHMDRPPAVAALMQRAGIILGVAHHKVHHTPPFDKYYCITTGWMNPVMHRLRLLRALEWAIARALGPQAIHR